MTYQVESSYPYEGCYTHLVAATKAAAWRKFRELLAGEFADLGNATLRLYEWREDGKKRILISSDTIRRGMSTKDWHIFGREWH